MNRDWSMVQFDASDSGSDIRRGTWNTELVDGSNIKIRATRPDRILYARSIKALREGFTSWAIHDDTVSLNRLAAGKLERSWRSDE